MLILCLRNTSLSTNRWVYFLPLRSYTDSLRLTTLSWLIILPRSPLVFTTPPTRRAGNNSTLKIPIPTLITWGLLLCLLLGQSFFPEYSALVPWVSPAAYQWSNHLPWRSCKHTLIPWGNHSSLNILYWFPESALLPTSSGVIISPKHPGNTHWSPEVYYPVYW